MSVYRLFVLYIGRELAVGSWCGRWEQQPSCFGL